MPSAARPRRSSFVVLVVAAGLVFTGEAGGADAGSPTTLPACIGVKTDSRWVPYGYNHVVLLTNGCSRPASCSVSTDVNPSPQSVALGKGESAEVTTFLGSPSATFTAKVHCALR